MINENLSVLATFYVVVIGTQQTFKNYIPMHDEWQLLLAITTPFIAWLILKKIRDKKQKY